jgi:hypothetical protein
MNKNWFTNLIGSFLALFKKPPKTTTTTTRPAEVFTTTSTTHPVLGTTTTTLGGKKMKVALVSAINNYPGTENDLSGCVPDAQDWKEILLNQYGFDRVDILLDSDVTIKNTNNKLRELSLLKPDTLVWCYSGHGSSVVDTNGDEPDGKDECLCLFDGFYVDDDIRKFLDTIESNTMDFVFFCDSCHSGSITREFMRAMNDFSYISTPKYMPPRDNMDALNLAGLPLIKSILEVKEIKNEILFTGTTSDSYSYDASFNGKSNGAFTYYCLQVLKDNPVITYGDFYKKLRILLPSRAYPQTPQFEPSNEQMANKIMFG